MPSVTDMISVKINHYMINRKSRVFEEEHLLLDYDQLGFTFLFPASVNVGIVNGTEAEPHSRPYMVSLQAGTQHFCGGFLVSEQFVMTAAHCQNQIRCYLLVPLNRVKKWTDVTAVIGAHILKTNIFQRIQVTEKYSHPHFTNDPKNPANDIMLLKLAKPVVRSENADWISIPKKDQDIEQDTTCSIAGWGRTENNGSVSDVLLEAKVTMLSSKKCKHWWKFNNILCTDTHHGGFCTGDSGGPLVCNNTAVGIMSFYVKNCVTPPTPYGYTKISGFLPWIKEIMGKMK
ncbi:mast cell protease 1A-like [Colossoma macropomum]|uniref:mast cell protease 1A-like n=1 Tax=Colossoma macropomum TaxID=42526 RepID=UPI0018653DD9|nr:mast cell protease 1A-like [Colossoma macropomum]